MDINLIASIMITMMPVTLIVIVLINILPTILLILSAILLAIYFFMKVKKYILEEEINLECE